MKRWQIYLIGVFALIVAGEALVYAQPAPNNCGLNMLCRVRTLFVSGNATFSGDAGVTGSMTISGDVTADHYHSTAAATENSFYVPANTYYCGNDPTCTASFVYDGASWLFTPDLHGQDAGFNNVSVTSQLFTADTNGTIRFGGTSGPGLAYGGAATVQTTSAVGFASLGALQGQSTLDVWDSLKNTANGANCTSNTAAVCVNDAAGLAIANGSGTTVATISAAGYMASVTPFTLGGYNVGAAATATTFGGHVLPARAFTITAVTTYVSSASGAGAGNTVFRFTDGTNVCDCTLACTSSNSTGAKRATCADTSGSGCAYPASAAIVEQITTTNCDTTQPTLLNVDIEGKWQ